MSLRSDISLDDLRRRGDGYLPGLIGLRFVELALRRIVAELDIRTELLAPNGYLHAATVIALADTACGYGTVAHMPDGASNFTTIELKSNFLGTARDGTLQCVATPAHLGRTTQVWDATVTRKSDQGTIALFRCTQMLLAKSR
ncbi:MAG TPA: PaaI family thioesterase [Casimicrobiaceae bacterium]|nr:PaaI family thioesterase [Casimicrobiaceae bacterium]